MIFLRLLISAKAQSFLTMEPPGLTPAQTDFLPFLRAINQSLKKRFFRKPNIADAVEQYINLSHELKRGEQEEYSAICLAEAAKCQEAMQNPIDSASTLIKAANYLLEVKRRETLFEVDGVVHMASRGKLHQAIQYLDKAAKIYQQQQYPSLCLLTTIMIAETLLKATEYGESLKYYKKALEMSQGVHPLEDQLIIIDSILKIKVTQGELESASKLVNETLVKMRRAEARKDFPSEWFETFVRRYELNGVLLLLILGNESVDVAKFLWPDSALPESEMEKRTKSKDPKKVEGIYCLKSLVMAVENGNAKEILKVKDYMSSILTQVECDLLSALISLVD